MIRIYESVLIIKEKKVNRSEIFFEEKKREKKITETQSAS
jgi:hypothetical protein